MYSDIPRYNGTSECVQHLIDAYGPVESIPKRERPKQFRIAPYPQHRPAHTTQIRNIHTVTSTLEENVKVEAGFENINPIIIDSDLSNEDVTVALPNLQTVGTKIETPSVLVSVDAIATGLTPPIFGQKNTVLEYYKKAAIYFSCGFRLLRDKIDDVPSYMWGDDTADICPYRAQLREGKWPDNFLSLGQTPFLELLDQMTKNI